MIRHYICAAIAGVSAILLTSCGDASSRSSAQVGQDHGHSHEATDEVHVTRAQTDIVGISFGSPEYAEIATRLHCPGRLAVDPSGDAAVTPLMPGVVKRVFVTAGERVAAGQAVAEIENVDAIALQQQYLQAGDRLALARSELDRQQALARQGAGIARNLQSAQAELDMAQAEYDGLTERLRMAGIDPARVTPGRLVRTMTVKAPIAGTVSGITVGTGSYADGTQAIMTILDASGIYCVANVFEKDLPLVVTGETAAVTLLNNPAITIPGKITSISPAIDPATKAVEVRVDLNGLPGDAGRLLPGMGVTVLLDTGRHRQLTLPAAAVMAEGGKNFVFVVEEEDDDELHLVKTPVATGVAADGLVAILPSPDGTSPITTDTKVVTDGTFYIASMAADHGEHNH